jgi:hypothetical protein
MPLHKIAALGMSMRVSRIGFVSLSKTRFTAVLRTTLRPGTMATLPNTAIADTDKEGAFKRTVAQWRDSIALGSKFEPEGATELAGMLMPTLTGGTNYTSTQPLAKATARHKRPASSLCAVLLLHRVPLRKDHGQPQASIG